ncbi:MAG: zinc-binding dehydrogenase [Sandaracinaceae bacterium]|nr:zinc-binding dehydrogenase [Sandaracinaceae bacterium]
MRAIWIPKAGKANVLELRESPDPEPKAGEVRVRVHAAGLNFAEVMARQGLYPDAPKMPFVPGYEAAGLVDAVGEGVTSVKVGDRVAALTRFGGHADCVVVPENQIFGMPASMTFEQAAALPVNYLTAYHMLFQVARIKPGDHVLIHMAAGGVGTAVLQLCKTVPDITTYGTASAGKHDYVRSHGCDHAIDYRTNDYVEEIKKLTDGRGVNLIMDALGGRDWKKGYSILRSSGQLIAFGWANMNSGEKRNLGRILKELTGLPLFSPRNFMDDNRGMSGVNLGHLWHEVDMLADQARALMVLFEQGKIMPHVDKVFPFAEAAEAHRYLEQGKNVGKVVLVP